MLDFGLRVALFKLPPDDLSVAVTLVDVTCVNLGPTYFSIVGRSPQMSYLRFKQVKQIEQLTERVWAFNR